MARAKRRDVPPVPEGWTPRVSSDEDLEALLARLPDDPGVYVMRDRKGEVVYVGKARKLRVRVRQYFNGQDTRLFVPVLHRQLGDIETVVTSNDKEALLLENNLIKEHRPRYNVKLRDDKQYLVLRLDPRANWPRLELVRRIKQDGAQYFGPYHSAISARATLRVVNRHFQLRTCTDYVLSHRSRACLQYQIGRCGAPCVYDVDPEDYGAQVKDVGLFLSGRHRELVGGLQARMESAAEGMEFEIAARLRDQVHAIQSTLERQQVVGSGDVDQDAFGLYREGGQVELVVLHVRGGKLLGNQVFSERGMELPDEEVLADFVSTYYDQAPMVPDEVLLPFALREDDQAPLEEWLRDKKGKKVSVAVPVRGDRKKLISLANRNAGSSFVTRRNRREDADAALARLQTRLGLTKLPQTIECYDISHIQGQDTVASMVVFVDGVPEKSRYRSFKIRGVIPDEEGAAAGLAQGTRQNDDFASMYEVLSRRFRRALQADAGADDESWALPDLIVIDGGKGQLGRVAAAMQDLGIPVGAEGADLVSLAKERKTALGHGRQALEKIKAYREAKGDTEGEDPGAAYRDYVVEAPDGTATDDAEGFDVKPERVFVIGAKDPIRLRPGSSERYLMERVRDEAHRFAITHHRKKRGKRALKSALDDIPGVGPALKKALVKHFGSVAAIKSAEESALCAVPGVGPKLAAKIRETVGE